MYNYLKKSLILCVTLTLSSGLIYSQNQTLVVNVKDSKIEWAAINKKDYTQGYFNLNIKKDDGHTGYFMLNHGTVNLAAGKLQSGSFEINIKDLVLKLPNDDFADHLKNADFFEVNKYPTAQFTIETVNYTSNNECEISGSLTFKGITKKINFPATTQYSAEKGFFGQAYFMFNRLNFGVNYDSEGTHENVQIAVYLVAKKN
ncbi:MAG: YceI family protein [Alphaproteobacteria bacterium]|nr:YceI family protein [Alphaproteobacteria bacterium]